MLDASYTPRIRHCEVVVQVAAARDRHMVRWTPNPSHPRGTGYLQGSTLSAAVGLWVGRAVGLRVGTTASTWAGATVCLRVGTAVGVWVGR